LDEKPLSAVTPREAVPAFMQKEWGRVPILPKRGGWVQNIFRKRGGRHPLLFFWRGGLPSGHMGGGSHFWFGEGVVT